MYTIGETAKMLNLAPSTLRFYDKEGLLPFVERTEGNIRVFKDEDFEWLSLIECLKAASMPIRDIKQFIDWVYEGDATLEDRRNMFYDRKRAVEAEIARMQQTLATLEFKCWYYDTACRLGSSEAVSQLGPEDLPPRIRAARQAMAERQLAKAP